mgnify:CR=1 FL=1
MKHILYFVTIVAAAMFVACGENVVTPDTPEAPIEKTTPEEPNEKPPPEPEPEPLPEPKQYPEGTYHFSDGVSATVYTLETNGLRNDYMSFLDNATGHTLYIDLYSELSNENVAIGEYVLGDGSAMTCDQSYTYLVYSWSDELYRFEEGSAFVVVDVEHESGYPWYQITGYFLLSNGESVSLDFEGQVIEKSVEN